MSMQENDLRPRSERPPSKDTWVTSVNVITISGPSGTGKTTLAEYFSEWIHELRSTKIGGGGFFRGSGKEYVGFEQRDTQTDQDADKFTEELIKSTIAHNRHAIIEGRLAGWVATKVKNELSLNQEKPKIIRILIDADDGVRFERIHKRENQKRLEEGKDLLTYEEVKQKTIERENGDNEIWHQAHPEMIGNPLDSKDEATKEIYDLVIDATSLSVRDVGAVILRFMLENQLVDIRGLKEKPKLEEPQESNETIIFDATI